MADNFFNNVTRTVFTRSKVQAATEISHGIKGVVGQATGGLIGDKSAGGNTEPSAAARAEATEALRRYGRLPGATPSTPPAGDGIGGFLSRLGQSISGAVLPSEATIDRLKRGAAAATVAVSGVTANGVALAQDGSDALKRAISKPTAEEIAKRVASGELDGHKAQQMINAGLVELPNASTVGRQKPAPVEDRSFSAGPVPAATIIASVTPASSGGQPFVLVTPQEHAASMAAETGAVAMPVREQAPIDTKPLTPTAGPDKPAIVTTIALTTDFSGVASPAAAAAAPAKPSATFGIDAVISEASQNGANADRLETLRKAREQVAKLDSPSGMG